MSFQITFGDKDLNLDQIKSQNPSCTLYRLKQIHSARVWDSKDLKGDGLQEGDALVSTDSNVTLAVATADCLPLLAHGRVAVGACHAGWRGVHQNIILEFVEKLKALGEKPSEIQVAIGPAIGVCHFEVGQDVATHFERFAGAIRPHPNPVKAYVDLKSVAKSQLLSSGILERNIQIRSECTYCLKDKYHSYRRNGPNAGRQFSFIVKN